jgi:SSS family solute:Na+ symporter
MLLALSALLVLRGQGIVATMVSVNVIYIASIAITFACLVAGRPLAAGIVMPAMLAGFVVSLISYLMGWGQSVDGQDDLISLLAGLAASASILLFAGVGLCVRAMRKV